METQNLRNGSVCDFKILTENQNDKEKLKVILEVRPSWYRFLSEEMKNDEEIIFQTIKNIKNLQVFTSKVSKKRRIY